MIDIINKPLFINPVINSTSDNSDDDYVIRAKLEKILTEKKILFSSISRFQDAFYIIRLDDGASIIVSGFKDIDNQISSLQFILSRLTMEGKEFSRLDLRFEKPVIVLK